MLGTGLGEPLRDSVRSSGSSLAAAAPDVAPAAVSALPLGVAGGVTVSCPSDAMDLGPPSPAAGFGVLAFGFGGMVTLQRCVPRWCDVASVLTLLPLGLSRLRCQSVERRAASSRKTACRRSQAATVPRARGDFAA